MGPSDRSTSPPTPCTHPPRLRQAIRERADAVKAARLKLFVRRGGPNYRAGLDAMRALGSEIGIDIEVYGPEASMTGICKLAIDHLKDSDARDAKAAQ